MTVRTQLTAASAGALLSSVGFFNSRLSGRLCRRWTRACSLYPNWFGMPAIRLLARTEAGNVACDPRDGVQSTLLERGEWEPTVGRTLSRILRPGDVFIDIGANIGYFSLLASRAVGKDGLVLAVEPLQENIACLTDTCSRNKVRNVICLGVALNDVNQIVSLHLSGDGQVGLTSLRPIGAEARPVLGCRFDGLIDGSLFDRVRLIKMDVEGAEMNVLKGMDGLFQRGHRPYLLCEVTDSFLRCFGATAADLVQRIGSYGYQLFATPRQGDVAWEELRIDDLPAEQFDLLCVPDGADTQALLKTVAEKEFSSE